MRRQSSLAGWRRPRNTRRKGSVHDSPPPQTGHVCRSRLRGLYKLRLVLSHAWIAAPSHPLLLWPRPDLAPGVPPLGSLSSCCYLKSMPGHSSKPFCGDANVSLACKQPEVTSSQANTSHSPQGNQGTEEVLDPRRVWIYTRRTPGSWHCGQRVEGNALRRALGLPRSPHDTRSWATADL